MKTFVVYDSQFSNTKKIAQAIAAALGSKEMVALRHVSEVNHNDLAGLSLLVVGSPTQRFNVKPTMKEFLASIPGSSLRGVRVAAFDTRFPQSEIDKTPPLPFFVKVWGQAAYAAWHIAKALKKKGGQLVLAPQGFYVGGTEGPLLVGELERATVWAEQLVKIVGAEASQNSSQAS